MESGQPNQSEIFTTHVQTYGILDPSRTLVHPLWRTPLGCDIFDRLGISQPSLTTPLTPVVTSTITTSSNLFLVHPMGQIGNIVAISGQVSSGIGLVLPSQLNNAMMIVQTIPFQVGISSTSQNLIGTLLLPREGQSIPPKYNALSGKIPNPTHISLGVSNPPGGQSGQHLFGSQFFVGTQIPVGWKPLVGGQNLVMGQPFTGS
jgi:hypothetical protein